MADPDGKRDEASIEEALDELRSTFDDDQKSEGWRRNLALIGILTALFGVVAWQTLLNDRGSTALIRFELNARIAPEFAWVEPGFSQVFAAYSQSGNRIRLQRDGEVDGGTEGLGFLAPSRAGPSSDADLSMRLAGPDTDGALELRLELEQGGTRQQAVLSGDVDALADLASRATLQLFSWLSIDPYTAQEIETAGLEIPSDAEAARHYALGIQALRRGEGRAAVDELSQALETEPAHPMVNAALASALELAGYRSRATQQVRLAHENSEQLSRERQLAIEAQMRLLQRDWAEAETLYTALTAFYPEEIGYGLSLVEARQNAGQLEAAEAALQQLGKRAEFAGDPRVDLAEARLWYRTGDWSKGVLAVERAIEKAQLLGHTGTVARGLLLRAEMEGDPSGGGLELAEELLDEIGDLRGRSRLLREYGDRHVANGRLDEAIATYNEAEHISERLGNDADVAAARQARVIATDLAGRLEEGYRLKQALLEDAERRQLYARAAIIRENLGISAFKLGKLSDSLGWYDAALKDFGEVDDQIGIAWYPYRKGQVLAGRGALSEAAAHFREALANATDHPEGNLALHTRYELARLAVFTGEPDVRSTLEGIARAYQEAELFLDEAITLVVLAHQDLIDGQVEQARDRLRPALAVFRDSGSAYYASRALSLLVRSGDLSVCDELDTAARNLQHREDALLALAAVQACPGLARDVSGDLESAVGSQLFEAVVALTAVADPAGAKALAADRGWTHSAYWSGR